MLKITLYLGLLLLLAISPILANVPPNAFTYLPQEPIIQSTAFDILAPDGHTAILTSRDTKKTSVTTEHSESNEPQSIALRFLEGFFGGNRDALSKTVGYGLTLSSSGEYYAWTKEELLSHAYTPSRDIYVTWRFEKISTSYYENKRAIVEGLLTYTVHYRKGAWGISFGEYSYQTRRQFYLGRDDKGYWQIDTIRDLSN